jgi:Ca-activated chloride channel family protein
MYNPHALHTENYSQKNQNFVGSRILMLKRRFWRAFSLLSLITLANLHAVHNVEAQGPQRPSQPKPTPQQKDPGDKKSAQSIEAKVTDPIMTSDDRITIDTDMVNLDVTVFDPNNNPVMTLKKEDFSVYEDRVKQTVENVIRQELPISFGMVIDTSASMRPKIDTVVSSAGLLVKQMRQDDEAFVVSFKNEPEMVQDFTSDRQKLEAALGDLYTGGGTALLDAIIATSDHTQEKGKRRRKALIVITDGLEKNSSVKEQEVMDAIRENEVQLYLVGFIDDEMNGKSPIGGSSSQGAKELLSRIADDSGGRAYFPKSIDEIPAIAAQISKDLRTQYVVSYYSTNDNRDGSFRFIQVGVNYVGGRKLITRARRGYYSRDAQGQLPLKTRKRSRIESSASPE